MSSYKLALIIAVVTLVLALVGWSVALLLYINNMLSPVPSLVGFAFFAVSCIAAASAFDVAD